MQRETRTVRAFRPSQYRDDEPRSSAAATDLHARERSARIPLYARRAREGLPLFEKAVDAERA